MSYEKGDFIIAVIEKKEEYEEYYSKIIRYKMKS